MSELCRRAPSDQLPPFRSAGGNDRLGRKPTLATRYHLIAPEYPGVNQSDAPSPDTYRYAFDHLSEATSTLLDQLGIRGYTLHLHDYGAPVGYRMILAHPDRLRTPIVQNGNAYREGVIPR